MHHYISGVLMIVRVCCRYLSPTRASTGSTMWTAPWRPSCWSISLRSFYTSSTAAPLDSRRRSCPYPTLKVTTQNPHIQLALILHNFITLYYRQIRIFKSFIFYFFAVALLQAGTGSPQQTSTTVSSAPSPFVSTTHFTLVLPLCSDHMAVHSNNVTMKRFQFTLIT